MLYQIGYCLLSGLVDLRISPIKKQKGFVMTDKKADAPNRKAIASAGGTARANSLSSNRLSDIAKTAANARWSTDIPSTLCEGEIDFAGKTIACAVLDTKLRVLTQQTFLLTLGRAGKAKGGEGSAQMLRTGGLPPFLAAENLQRFVSDELRQAATPVMFKTKRGKRAYGYDAKLLPLVCEVYLKARDAHLEALSEAQDRRKRGENVEAKPVLTPAQEPIVKTCDLLVRSMAREHIVTLVDRATGYQDQEVRDEITKILSAYIAPHLMPWAFRFPDEFFKQVYKIHGWKYVVGNRKMPQYMGKFINQYIYNQLPDGVLEKLKELNPVSQSAHRATQHHRHLTDTGNIHLDRQITSTTTMMTISENKAEFKTYFAKVHGAALEQSKPLALKAPKATKTTLSATLPLFPPADEQPSQPAA